MTDAPASHASIELRPATENDAQRLLAWRNDPLTRQGSHQTREVMWDEHLAWLRGVLANPHRRLFIAQEANTAVGMVRADWDGAAHELSWSVAPRARGRGLGKVLVGLLVDALDGPIRAEVKTTNMASRRIAEHLGMRLQRQQGGVLYYVGDDCGGDDCGQDGYVRDDSDPGSTEGAGSTEDAGSSASDTAS